MVDRSVDLFEAASNAWQSAMDQEEYDVAIQAGIDAYLHYQAEGSDRISRGALNLIHVAISRLVLADKDSAAGLSCSFCGRSGSEGQLGAGPDAYICLDCVTVFSKTLRAKRNEDRRK
jgi:ClpX C4-type zinc finger